MNHIFIGALIGIVIGVSISILVFYLRSHNIYENMSHILENYMGSELLSEEDCLETRESKIVSQLNRTLRMVHNKRLEAEKEKEGVTRFLADMSHQFKTPMANIRIYTDLLRDESLTREEMEEFVTRIDMQTEKMQWLMKMLFQASRLETGVVKFEAEPCDVITTIQAAVDSVRGQAGDHNIKLVQKEHEPCKVWHNPKWTAEAITNILENAIKYSGTGTTVTVSFELLSMYGRIRIEDQGIGIGKEEYSKIYQRFYRSEEVKDKQGSGLGLYLSQLILSLEGGYITVDSIKGQGSTFFIYLKRVS